MSDFKWLKSNSQLTNDLGFNRQSEQLLADTSARYMNPYVPYRDSGLSSNYETGVDAISGFVRYDSPYAHYQYTGEDFTFTKDMHPLATHHWDKAMLITQRDQLTREADLIRRRFAR